MSEIQDLVSRSSQVMAAVRALETERPDRLFADPYAAQLAGPEVIAQIEPKLKDYDDRGKPISNSKFKILNSKLGKSLRSRVSAFGSMQFKCATA